MNGTPRPHIRTVIVNALDRGTLAAFWSSVLEVEVREADDEAGITWLAADEPGGVNVGFQQVARKVAVHTEVHLDIAVADLDETEARVLSAGGAVIDRHRLAGGFEWRVLADPEGNEFCVFREA